jgi:hypothetical protein
LGKSIAAYHEKFELTHNNVSKLLKLSEHGIFDVSFQNNQSNDYKLSLDTVIHKSQLQQCTLDLLLKMAPHENDANIGARLGT